MACDSVDLKPRGYWRWAVETIAQKDFFSYVRGAVQIEPFNACVAGRLSALILCAIVFGMAASGLGLVTKAYAVGSEQSGVVELYEYGGDHSPTPLVLQIPKEFRYGSSVGQQKSWGTNILTFYPSLTSPKDPANAPYGLQCVGFCNGRILISIEYRPSILTRRTAQTAADAGALGVLRFNHQTGPPNVHVVDLEPQFGFDEVFDRTIEAPPGANASGSQNKLRVDRYLLRRSPDKTHYDSYAHCSMSTTVQGCEINFSLSCNPAIRVTVGGWPFQRMDQASEIQRRVEHFIAAMVKEPKCNP